MCLDFVHQNNSCWDLVFLKGWTIIVHCFRIIELCVCVCVVFSIFQHKVEGTFAFSLSVFIRTLEQSERD